MPPAIWQLILQDRIITMKVTCPHCGGEAAVAATGNIHSSKRLQDGLAFNAQFGFFYAAWAVAEALLDCALGQFLRLGDAETHLLTAGMPYGRKAALLRSLINRSNHANKAMLIHKLKVMQNESLRNVFAHSYLASDDKIITFVERSHSGDYWAKEHNFTLEEFNLHVKKFAEAMRDFGEALGVPPSQFRKFQHASLSVSRKA